MAIDRPFFVFNPKSYLYGENLLDLALEADKLAEEYTDVQVFVTCPYADLYNVAKHTKNITVTAQHIDGLAPGRGIGYVLPESVYEAGARATFLNHAERPLKLNDLVKSINRARELGIKTIVCADSLQEARAIATLEPDCILCEPTELIGTGMTSDDDYIRNTNKAIKEIDKGISIMQAAGISTGKDVYKTIFMGADGTGCTSGIIKAENPKQMLREMINAVHEAVQNRKEG